MASQRVNDQSTTKTVYKRLNISHTSRHGVSGRCHAILRQVTPCLLVDGVATSNYSGFLFIIFVSLWSLTLCEATASSTKLRKMQSYKSVFYQKTEALLPTTTLPCLKVFVSLITKNKSKSSWHTEEFSKSRLKEKSSRRMRTKCQNRKECSFLRCILSSPGHWQTSKLPQQVIDLPDRKIDLQTKLASRSQLESSAGKPLTSSSTIQTPIARRELRTTPLQGAGMKGSATSEGQNTNFFNRLKVFQSVNMIACHSAVCTRKMATLR